jgi:hypothetical protein
MGTINGQVITQADDNSSRHVASQGWPHWLARRRGVVIAAAAAASVAALALWQHWLAAAALVPLLFALPCAAMMFMCMKGMNHGPQTDTAQDTSPKERTTAGDLRS